MARQKLVAKRISLTEQANPLSRDLDLADPAGIVEIISRCDGELFTGPAAEDGGGILAPAVVTAAAEAVALIRAALPGKIAIGGAGTSGRLAFLLARRHGAACRAKGGELIPLIAGGDLALVKSQEGAEDDVPAARQRVAAALGEAGGRGLFLGITCGLSAPCVGGGLALALSRPRTGVILFGTNRADLARPVSLAGEDCTLHDLVQQVGDSPHGCLLLPDVGAEALTGSTRLKCGSATWLLLDLVLKMAWSDLPTPAISEEIRRALEQARVEAAQVYANRDFLSDLVARGGETLRSQGNIIYLGGGDQGLAGLLDASECPPTFGAAPDDVRAFVSGGWSEILGRGKRAETLEETWPVDLDFARHDYLPEKTGILPLLLGAPESIAAELARSGKTPIAIPEAGIFATKLLLNLLTTGAHVLAGKVYGNQMVDLRISNTKLFARACRIVAHIAEVDESRARQAIIRAGYGMDSPGKDLLSQSPADLVKATATREKVVPLAILLAGTGTDLTSAGRALAKYPAIREAIRHLLAKESDG